MNHAPVVGKLRRRHASWSNAGPRGHGGFTLVELLVVMTLMAVLIVLGTKLLLVLYKGQRTAADQLFEAVTIDRLAHQFQRDVQSADEVLPTAKASTPADNAPPSRAPGQIEAPAILRLRNGDTVVQYALGESQLARSVLRSGNVEERDQFRLQDLRASIEIESQGQSQVLTLTIREVGPSGDEAAVPRLQTRTMIGRDLRYAPPAKEGT
jgi:prepilin-type N-terminal cleavage/methylation domain-containing protein